jgi:hypothetical protein
VDVVLSRFGNEDGRIGWSWLAKPVRDDQE